MAKNATAPRFTRPVSPHWTFRPSVKRARTPTRVTIAVRYAITPGPSRARAGEAGRANEQNGQDDHEADRRLVSRGHEQRAGFLHDTHDQRPREGPRRRADSAENGRGKDRDDEAAAHQRVDAGVQAEEDAGAARERAAAEGGDRDHALGRNALDGG